MNHEPHLSISMTTTGGMRTVLCSLASASVSLSVFTLAMFTLYPRARR